MANTAEIRNLSGSIFDPIPDSLAMDTLHHWCNIRTSYKQDHLLNRLGAVDYPHDFGPNR